MLSLEEKVERERLKQRARVEERVQRLTEWWPILWESYEVLISRSEETSSVAGFDDSPRKRPCECLARWRYGKLCLACDNTGWRKVVGDEEGVDPYSAQLSRGVTIVKDESPSARRAREAERNDQILAGLERDARVRAGLEAMEDTPLRQFRSVTRKPFTARRILRAVELLRVTDSVAYESLPSDEGFWALAELMYRTERRQRQLPPPPV